VLTSAIKRDGLHQGKTLFISEVAILRRIILYVLNGVFPREKTVGRKEEGKSGEVPVVTEF
jgi:hypothetical protein